MNRSHEYARMLLTKARDDRYVVEHLAGEPGAPAWIVGFHAQQAVEKAIKAVLSDRGVEYPRTHNLTLVTELVRGAGLPLPPDAADLARLTPYGAGLRYEAEVDGGLQRSLDRAWARGIVQRTMSWAEGLLASAGEKP